MQQALQFIRQSLSALYPEAEARHISFLVVEKVTGWSHTQVLMNKNTTFSEVERQQVAYFVEKLQKAMPVQYVLGEAEFYGLMLTVNDSVLIPRPETEELVEWISDDCAHAPAGRLLDIGTGSGCIPVALKHRMPSWSVDAFDISSDALAIAEGNAGRHNTDVCFHQIDILHDNVPDTELWDVIVSNPPYIPERERQRMELHVLDYEPALALFVPDDDPLVFYDRIASFALRHLTPTGKLYFEIHYDAGRAVTDLLYHRGFHRIELRQDLAGKDRMIRAER